MSLGNLRVIVFEENGLWNAQGLEIDYFAQGSNSLEARSNFVSGLRKTLEVQLERLGSFERFLVPAPAEIWREYTVALATKRITLARLNVMPTEKCEFPELRMAFPFSHIEFLLLQGKGA